MRRSRRLLHLVLSVALAVVALGRVAASADDDAALRAELAAHVRSGDDAALLRTAEAALARAPQSIPALAHRGFALQRLGRVGEARAAYEALLTAAPEHVWGLTRLGAMHASERRFQPAVELLRRAVELAPADAGAQRALVAALRGSGDLDAVAVQLHSALETVDPVGWVWGATAEIDWMRGDIDAAWESLERAERLGVAGIGRLREVLTLDRRMLAAAQDPDALCVAWRERKIWTFDVGGARVRTSVGPRLPGDIVRMVRELPERFAAVVGNDRRRDPELVLRVSRTLDEHERVRRVMYPQGSPGRAFTVTGGRAPRGGTAGEVTIYVAWTSDDVKTSLAHELAHAALRGAAADVPVWLDEGVAVYLEKLRHGTDDVALERSDLESPLRAALAEGRAFTWPRMMAAQRADFEGDDGRLRYAQAWSMVRFLLHASAAGADDATRRNRFVRMLRTGNRLRGPRSRGPGRGGWADWKVSLEEVYDAPLETLEDAWRAALR